MKSLRSLAPEDISHYVEPFAGSAVMYFALEPKSAFIADLNGALINFYHWLKSNPKQLYALTKSYERSRENYLDVRAQFDSNGSTMKSAAQFLFLNYNCFNGIYRTNKSGKFNVPFSGDKTPRMPDWNEFLEFSTRIQTTVFECCDFRNSIVNNLKMGTFFYIDPPYFTDEHRVFREYGPKYFSEKDLYELSDLLTSINNSGGQFMLSYADSQLARELFAHWNINHINLTRNIGGFVKTRKSAAELIIRNFEGTHY